MESHPEVCVASSTERYCWASGKENNASRSSHNRSSRCVIEGNENSVTACGPDNLSRVVWVAASNHHQVGPGGGTVNDTPTSSIGYAFGSSKESKIHKPFHSDLRATLTLEGREDYFPTTHNGQWAINCAGIVTGEGRLHIEWVGVGWLSDIVTDVTLLR